MRMIHSRMGMPALLIGTVASLISPSVLAEQASVTVNVRNVRSQKGDVVVCLFRQQDKGFPICSTTESVQRSSAKAYASTVAMTASIQHVIIKAAASNVTATFQNVPPGDYAISAFHDENQNGKLERGFMGKPEEGIAASNMIPDARSQPSFEKSKITVNGAKTISFSFVYL
jgi:uncharacterized protein (DUF2141 family)